jgi:hypothetical protein
MKRLPTFLLILVLITGCRSAPSVDTTPPIITEVTASGITETSVVISWITNEPSDAQIEYGLTTTYGVSLGLETTLSTSHGADITELEPNSTYHFRVKSSDAAGNQAVSDDYSFITDNVYSASYEVTFESTWSGDTHPYEFPSSPHFSGLIGVTHNVSVDIWQVNQLASPGIKNMAETGSKDLLNSEIDETIASGDAYSKLSGGGISSSPGIVSLTFEIHEIIRWFHLYL